MNRRLTLSASVIVIGGLALGLAAGCASKSMSKMGSGDVVADRQRLMKAVGANWADIQAKAKAGNIEGIAVNAETLALSAQHIPSMFPEGSGTEKSKAKPGSAVGEAAGRLQGEERAADAGHREGLRAEHVRRLPHPVPPAAAPDVAAPPHHSGPAPPAPRAGPAPYLVW